MANYVLTRFRHIYHVHVYFLARLPLYCPRRYNEAFLLPSLERNRGRHPGTDPRTNRRRTSAPGVPDQAPLPEDPDLYLPPHPLRQGLSNGWLITIWMAYILSRANHHKSRVRECAHGLRHTLETCTGQTIRDVDFP